MPINDGLIQRKRGEPLLYETSLPAVEQLPEPKTVEQLYGKSIWQRVQRLEQIFLSMDHSLKILTDYFTRTIVGEVWSSTEQVPGSTETPLDLDFQKSDQVLFSLVIYNIGVDPVKFRIPRSGPWTTIPAGSSAAIFFQTPLIKNLQLQSATTAQGAVSLMGQY